MGLFGPSRSDASTAIRLAAVERKLDAIMRHLGLELPTEEFGDVRLLAQSGQHIQAIKLYRERTGAGLAQAKAFVDALR